MTNRLHIISFDIPFPADYGGVMDVFYKIKALHEAGISVVLHCFQYRDRVPQAELTKYCAEVHYYPRSLGPLSILDSALSRQPFIVRSRASDALLKNLLKDTAPILFEGLHTCAHVGDKRLRGRQKIVRMHNVEWEYYRNLNSLESRFWKKIYFATESKKLQSFENQVVRNADVILTISPDDTAYFQTSVEKLNLPDVPKVVFVPPFHPNTMVESRTGTGDYVLFHGKLSVSDNEEAAVYLIKKVFANRDIPLVIAGKEPSERLLQLAKQYENVTIKANPNETDMVNLIQNAQINVLLSFQKAGMKLKLLNALYRGRHCVVNRFTVQNTGLESLCYVKNTSRDIRSFVESLMNVQLSNKQILERKAILERDFSNVANAAKIVEILRF